ncbi:unnamed protein product [Arctogadus glacialis]
MRQWGLAWLPGRRPSLTTWSPPGRVLLRPATPVTCSGTTRQARCLHAWFPCLLPVPHTDGPATQYSEYRTVADAKTTSSRGSTMEMMASKLVPNTS